MDPTDLTLSYLAPPSGIDPFLGLLPQSFLSFTWSNWSKARSLEDLWRFKAVASVARGCEDAGSRKPQHDLCQQVSPVPVLGVWQQVSWACPVSGRKSSRLESAVCLPGPGGQEVLESQQIAPGYQTTPDPFSLSFHPVFPLSSRQTV